MKKHTSFSTRMVFLFLWLFCGLLALSFCFGCKKESDIEPTVLDRSYVGTWVIQPIGDPETNFTYKIFSDVDSLYGKIISGKVSEGPFTIPVYGGYEYSIWYRSTIGDTVFFNGDTIVYWHKSIHVEGHPGSHENFSNNLPATIY